MVNYCSAQGRNIRRESSRETIIFLYGLKNNYFFIIRAKMAFCIYAPYSAHIIINAAATVFHLTIQIWRLDSIPGFQISD